MLVKAAFLASLALVAQSSRTNLQGLLESESAVDQETQGTYTCSCDGQQVMKMGHLAAIGLGAFPCLQKCAELGAKQYCTYVSGASGGKSCEAVPTKEKFCVKTKCESGLTSFGQCSDTFDVTEEVSAFKSKLVGGYFAREAARKCSGWCSEDQTIDEGPCAEALVEVHENSESDSAVDAETQGTYTCSCDGQQVMKMGHLAAIGLGAFPCLQKCAELGAKQYCTYVSGGMGGSSCQAVPTKEKFCVKTKCESGLTSFGQCSDTFDVTEEVSAFKSKLTGGYFAREAARKCSGWCSEDQTIDDGPCP